MRGHQRVPSGSREFKELTKKDAQTQLEHELQELLATAEEETKKTVEQEFQGFQRLFERFLLDQGSTINWDRIEKLPENAVRFFSTVHARLGDWSSASCRA